MGAASGGGGPSAGGAGRLVGAQIAGYRVESELGRGGMAVVYRARDLRLQRTVALKLLTEDMVGNDTFRRRFAHEQRVAAALDHPHIVPVFEAGEADGVLYIAMRYVPGPDLRALLDRDGPLPVSTALRIAAQVASALDAAHEHDLVHRDVKPGNVLVARGTDSDHPEHVYLTDFGLTKKSLSLTGFTSVGEFVGTLDYVAPEQIAGRPVDGRCDLYSLACVVYETLAGQPPFRRDDPLELLWAHQYDTPPALSERRPGTAAAMDEVLARALAKACEDRYSSCLQFVAALRAAAQGGTGRGEAGRGEAALGGVERGGLGVRAPVLPDHTGAGSPPDPPAWAQPVFAGPAGPAGQ
ncbi:serine/threonine-protein kinase [Streptomyces cavernicola]|uniref:non-specific serine/threonine protein kinase n=1 Tax=Streptomyces cavernicola TaxID=3043613 RepID=A0ABT6SP99_9ACTN|nr:serine/threonine-protein kinase [Streptomyces sp. B-S-A6]MDI3409507.1 serine/threonine-protein kinase [Streptomyces sp. B-S-A6]